MLNDFLVVAGQVLILFLMMGVGFFLARRGHLDDHALSQLSYLLLYIVAPCVVIDALLKAENSPELTHSILLCTVALLLTYAVNMVLSAPLYPRTAPDTRDTLRFAMIYGNTGFMGLPLVQSVLGADALIYCTITLAVFNIATWTHGAVLMGGRANVPVKKAILNPGVVGCVVGFFFFFSGVTAPSPLATAVDYLADLNTPLAMVVIGGQMASVDLAATFRRPTLYAVSGVKLILIPLLNALILIPFHLDPLCFSTLVILAACPTAGLTSIFAQSFRRDTATAAQSVTLSTLLSILTLPLMTLAARMIGG